MPEPLEGEPTSVTLESDALPQEDFRPGDLRRYPEAPGNLNLGQAELRLCLHQASLK
jgi:hypothetical protein